MRIRPALRLCKRGPVLDRLLRGAGGSPGIFWVGSSAQISENSLTGQVVSYQLSTTVDPESRDYLRAQLEAAADQCIGQIPSRPPITKEIRMVYEYIINTTDYNSASPDNQNIQSALLNHSSVCAGYSKAFQYILHRMGMFCTYVTGQTMDGGDHGWNNVRIGISIIM